MIKSEYVSPELEIMEIPEILTANDSGELGEDELPFSPFDW